MKVIKNYNQIREELLTKLQEYLEMNGVTIKNRKFKCISPNHIDKHPSSAITRDGKYFKCFACEEASGTIFDAYSIIQNVDILGKNFIEAIIHLANTFGIPIEYEDMSAIPKKTEYIYHDEEGNIVMKVSKHLNQDGKKEFFQSRYSDGQYISGVEGLEPYIYNYPRVLKAIDSKKIIILVEGEKLADMINRSAGSAYCATSISGGSNDKNIYFERYASQLKGASLYYLPDNDDVGEKFMKVFAFHLKKTVKSLKKVLLKEFFSEGEFPEKGDYEQFIQLGGTMDMIFAKALNSDEESEYREYMIEDSKGKKNINKGLLANYLNVKYPSFILQNDFAYVYDESQGYHVRRSNTKSIILKEVGDFWSNRNLLAEVDEIWKLKMTRKDYEEVDRNTEYINVKNGLYNVEEKCLYPHRYDIDSTVQLDVEFNPEADGSIFHEYLDRLQPDKRWQSVMQEDAGYTLSNFLGMKYILVLHGPGDTGKSGWLILLKKMFRRENKLSMSVSQIDEKFQLSQYMGKNICTSGEITGKTVNVSDVLKRLLSDDLNSMQKHEKENFDFRNKAKIKFATNGHIHVDSKSYNMYKKFLFTPFYQEIAEDERDIEFEYTLNGYKEYFFIWAMEGLSRLISNGFIHTEKDLIEAHRKERYRLLKTVKSFIEDKVEFVSGSYETTEDLFRSYEAYLIENNLEEEIDKIGFAKIFKGEIDIDGQNVGPKSGRKKGYVGIKLKK